MTWEGKRCRKIHPLGLSITLFQLTDPVGKGGQPRQPPKLLLEALHGPGRRSPYHLTSMDRFPGGNARLRAHNSPVLHLTMVGDSHLATDQDAFAHGTASRNADLRCHDRVFANGHVVGDLNQVIDLHTPGYPRGIE